MTAEDDFKEAVLSTIEDHERAGHGQRIAAGKKRAAEKRQPVMLSEYLRELLERHGETIRRALENEVASAEADAHTVRSAVFVPMPSADSVIALEEAKQRLATAHLSRAALAMQALAALDSIEEGL